jgi:hypothetical protein
MRMKMSLAACRVVAAWKQSWSDCDVSLSKERYGVPSRPMQHAVRKKGIVEEDGDDVKPLILPSARIRSYRPLA